MALLNSIINWLNIKRMHQIDLFRKYPFDVQKETLFRLLQSAAGTEYGKKFSFTEIQSISDFQKKVPLKTYEDVRDDISRLRNGENNIFWPGEIKWFAKSSGTTSDKSKFIPVSMDSLEDCHFRGGKDTLLIFTNNHPDTRIFTGKSLTLGGSHQISNFSTNSYFGDLSAILIENLPFWAHFIRTPSQEVALMDEWEKKLDSITRETIRENVTTIAGVPSWNLVLIKYILDFTGKKNLLEVWPNLELFIHGGVSFPPYRGQFNKLIPSPKMNYLEVYNASEGFFAIQDDPASEDMLLMLDYGIFYEFIPVSEFHSPEPSVLSINEVTPDTQYALVISTNGGLWRYIIGDTIVFTSLYPHKIKISGRTRHFMNAFGEEVIIDNAENALRIANEKTGAVISEYTAAPVYMGDEARGAHEWLIEFEVEPPDLDYFTGMLDNALCSLNSDYEAKRYKNITLALPIVRSVRKGTFYNWLSRKGKLGGQNKVPRLSNDRKILEELLELQKELN